MNKLILFVLVIVSLHMACNADESTINLRKNDQILSDTLPETVIETTPESTSMPTFKFSDLFTEDEKSCVEECQDVSIIAPPQTVTEQDVSAYLGRWYQMYASFGAVKTYEKNLFCITADYTLSEQYPGSFEILNQGQSKFPGRRGTKVSIQGYGYPQCDCTTGKWLVKFDSSEKPGYYWVYELGPINKDGLYDYSVVTAPFGLVVFILARDPQTFKKLYEDDLLKSLKDAGFSTPWNSPIETYQGKDCVYH